MKYRKRRRPDLTLRLKQVLNVIEKLFFELGYFPGTLDLQFALGLKSQNTARMFMARLAKRGYLVQLGSSRRYSFNKDKVMPPMERMKMRAENAEDVLRRVYAFLPKDAAAAELLLDIMNHFATCRLTLSKGDLTAGRNVGLEAATI